MHASLKSLIPSLTGSACQLAPTTQRATLLNQVLKIKVDF